jgi:hypothetical protein
MYNDGYQWLEGEKQESYCLMSTVSDLQNGKRAEQVLPEGWGRREVAQIMYTHVSKCKNNKII